MTYDELLNQVRQLPLHQRKALIYDLVESIASEIKPPDGFQRILGLHAGSTTYISDDFDEELPL